MLRPTRRLFPALPPTAPAESASDTALGDWYVNRLVVDRRPLLLLTSSRGLLPLLVPAREVKTLPGRLATLVAARLHRLGAPPSVVDAECAAMVPVRVARTTDRSVLGSMVDFAYAVEAHLERGRWDETTLPFVESRLAETPCHASRRLEEVIWPVAAAPKLLESRWGQA
ncbi:MAG: hypothetical protein IPK12_19725 [Gemmatimonadetes bacterium]|nr:hypothetical protein [Gemmatimonadota bacterium]